MYLSQTNILEKGEGGKGDGRSRKRVRVRVKRGRDCCRSMDGSLPLTLLFAAPASNILFPVPGCLQVKNSKECSVLHLIPVQPYSGNTGGPADRLTSLNVMCALCKGGAVGTLHTAVLQCILHSSLTWNTSVSCAHICYHLCPHISYTLVTQLLAQCFKKVLM